MQHSLLLLLKGPMQSWGDESRYKIRATGSTPSKSGVIGLLASALGRERTAPLDDLVRLDFAVRVDQPGTLLRDYQTAQYWQKKKPTKPAELVTRYFLADAAFVAAVGSEDRSELEGFQRALREPAYPLFLGRRSCPAPARLDLGIIDEPVVEALLEHDVWHATAAYKKESARQVELPIYRDGKPGEIGVARQDVPVSFAQRRREYDWRTVVFAGSKTIQNGESLNRDPFFDEVIS
ncbi:CRISPR system Cascade subunit CasD [Actinobaculum suis]|uniref:CRISPR system Cascade subunit CasD n=1 Tax=Actinobaculum suis TaxID=1657 RepID=A0A1G7EHT7_9ACTO|nr:type I-E CRISPR-associated protein Cas5/CasD [Actinobaculum suis]MDY5152548.1 type I-E CRISPR-associated protein Cas5/CasD [Actinobaculum suis]SDE63232.1 CRISPR system Cascade subunit CasD [Actinobaculum suis]